MQPRSKTVWALAAIFALVGGPVEAREPISAEDRDETVETIALYVSDLFYDEARANSIAARLRHELSAGAFEAISTTEDLSQALTDALSPEDRHFRVGYIGPEAVRAIMAGESTDTGADYQAEAQANLEDINYGFSQARVFPGNVAYLESQRFYDADQSREAAIAALAFGRHARAVIVDLRQNNGGPPSMVRFLASYFLSGDERVLLNTMHFRGADEPNQLWSMVDHPAGHDPDVPLFVLTSSRTGSAAEAFAYHLQAMGRAVIVGEVSAGAGNPGGQFLTDLGFSIFISTGSGVNPVTGTNWEGRGVLPDVMVGQEDALTTALSLAYDGIEAGAERETARRRAAWARELLSPDDLLVEQASRFAGVFGQREITTSQAHLFLSRNDGQPSRLIQVSENRFMFDGDHRSRLSFGFGPDGEANALVITGIDGSEQVYARTD